MPAKRKSFVKKLEPYPVVLRLILNDQRFSTPQHKNNVGLCIQDDSLITILINPNFDKKIQLGGIIHETTHAVQFVEEIIETVLDSESRAYLMQSIAMWVIGKAAISAS